MGYKSQAYFLREFISRLSDFDLRQLLNIMCTYSNVNSFLNFNFPLHFPQTYF